MTETLTAQEIFDTVAAHLRGMPQRSSKGVSCLYRGPNGLKCAVGCLITDEEYKEEMDYGSSSVARLLTQGLLPERLVPHVNLLSHLQHVHDSGANWNNGFVGEAHLHQAAVEFALTYTPPRAVK